MPPLPRPMPKPMYPAIFLPLRVLTSKPGNHGIFLRFRVL